MSKDRVRIKITAENGGPLPEAWTKKEGPFYRDLLALMASNGWEVVNADTSNPVRQMWLMQPSNN